MNLTAEEIRNSIWNFVPIKIVDNVAGIVEKIIGYLDDENLVVIKDAEGKEKKMSLECVNKIYDLCKEPEYKDEHKDELTYMEEEYKKCQIKVFPHEPLAALCYVFDDYYTEEEHEVLFTVPVEWLIEKLDEETGKRYWDEYKLFMWLNDEYTADDAEWIWEQAVEENKLVTFTVSY